MTRLLIGFALLLAALWASAIPAWADPDVRVPHVEGLSLEQAMHVLAQADLRAEVVWTNDGQRGRVLAQHPRARERVPAGSDVELRVRRRLEILTIAPDVVGMTEDEAITALEDVYVLEIEEHSTRPEQAGKIIGQVPRAGQQVLLGGVLRLAVGRVRHAGPVGIPLPDLVEMSHEEAEGVLLDLGLIPVPSYEALRRGRRPGLVRRQDPEPGTLVTHGARVALRVGIRPAPRGRVRVPSLHGLDPSQAAGILAALGLRTRIERLPSRYETDTVIRQKPKAGFKAQAGTLVGLVVATRAQPAHVPARVGVPEFVGVPLAEAFARARRAGVRLSVRHRRARGPQGEAVVLTQRPTAHVAVPLGTRVRIEAPLGIPVPDLVGLSAEAAATRMWEAGLELVFAGGRHARFGAVIVSQEPEGGTLVARRASVTVRLRGDAWQGRALVPDVRGLTLIEARTRLRQAGLEGRLVDRITIPLATLVVAVQNPAPGTRVPRATIVELTPRSQAVDPVNFVIVPDLRGLTLTEARRRLTQRGLIGAASMVRGPGSKGVTGQSPAPGTRVPGGSQVSFTVRL